MTMCGVTARAHVRAAPAFAVAQLCTHPVAAQVETPTAMVGKKIAPIWKDEGGPMMESLDIIAKMDPDGKIKWALRCPDACPLAPAPSPFPPHSWWPKGAWFALGARRPGSGRSDLKAWQKSVQTLMRKLCRPRYVKVPLLVESAV